MDHKTSTTAPRQRGATTGWWNSAVGYQVYLRSFCDTDGDGIGDLDGVRRHLGYLAELGIDYLWITPFYPSPQADHGYDVADYLDVDPVYGDLASFAALTAEAHALDLRVVIDIVPNHTSDRHPWFEAARRGRDDEYRDHYVWRDPAPGGGPPNNWVSKFGGPAWTLDAPSGQYYMHTFLAEQPDLNWANPQVHAAFDAVLRFWMDHGVDGFRIDTAHLLTEDAAYRDNPLVRPLPTDADPDATYFAYEHRHDLDQADVLDIYRRWQELTSDREVVLLGEVGLFEAEPVGRYVRDGALDLAFYFPTLKTAWDPRQIRAVLEAGTDAGGASFAWPLSSHDDPRAVQRFGGGAIGAERAVAYLALLLGLPGSPVLLQGDELGFDPSRLPAGASRDPVATRNPGAAGRDSSRTPMPWSRGPHHGFSTAEPWLPFPLGVDHRATVEHQRSEPGSILDRVRRLLFERAACGDLTGSEPVRWLDPSPSELVAYRRGDTRIVLNTGDTPVPFLATTDHRVRVASTTPTVERVADGTVHVPANSTVIIAPALA